MSRYQNCFYYFRGPRDASREAAATKQLEDNTTKALINVLEHGGPELTASFLREVAGRDVEIRSENLEFFLQGGPPVAAPERMLVGLSVLDEIDPTSWRDEASKGGSRIDAVIHVPDQLSVFVETKVVDQLEGAQLNRHASRWRIEKAAAGSRESELPSTWKLITWSDVDRWARSINRDEVDPLPWFLVSQLKEFLGYAGLSTSWMFESQHFDFFEKENPDDRDPMVQSEIRARLGSIWDRVKELIGTKEFERSLGEVRVGNLGPEEDHGFAYSHHGQPVKLPNLTLEIGRGEVTVNLTGTMVDQYVRIKPWLATPAAEQFFSDNPGYSLDLFRRDVKRSKHAQKPVWQNSRFEFIRRIDIGTLSGNGLVAQLDEFESSLDPVWEKPGIHVCRAWPRELAQDSIELPTQIANEVKRLIPALRDLRK